MLGCEMKFVNLLKSHAFLLGLTSVNAGCGGRDKTLCISASVVPDRNRKKSQFTTYRLYRADATSMIIRR